MCLVLILQVEENQLSSLSLFCSCVWGWSSAETTGPWCVHVKVKGCPSFCLSGPPEVGQSVFKEGVARLSDGRWRWAQVGHHIWTKLSFNNSNHKDLVLSHLLFEKEQKKEAGQGSGSCCSTDVVFTSRFDQGKRFSWFELKGSLALKEVTLLFRNMYCVWRAYLEGSIQVSQSRISTCENYKVQVSDHVKMFRLQKEQQLKKVKLYLIHLF